MSFFFSGASFVPFRVLRGRISFSGSYSYCMFFQRRVLRGTLLFFFFSDEFCFSGVLPFSEFLLYSFSVTFFFQGRVLCDIFRGFAQRMGIRNGCFSAGSILCVCGFQGLGLA